MSTSHTNPTQASPHRDSSAFADLEVLDAAGSRHLVGSFWRERAAVLAFVRHFG